MERRWSAVDDEVEASLAAGERPDPGAESARNFFARMQAEGPWLLALMEFRLHAARDPALNAAYAELHRAALERLAGVLERVTDADPGGRLRGRGGRHGAGQRLRPRAPRPARRGLRGALRAGLVGRRARPADHDLREVARCPPPRTCSASPTPAPRWPASASCARRDAWTRERLAAHQAERLGELVRHAVAHSPFYRERFAGIDTSAPIDLAALPPVRKDELMERFDDWVCDRRLRRDAVERHLAGLDGDALYLDRYRVMATGGTHRPARPLRLRPAGVDRAAARSCCAALRSHGVTPKLPRAADRDRPGAERGAHDLADQRVDGLRAASQPAPGGHPADGRDRRASSTPSGRTTSAPTRPSAALLAEEQLAGRLRIAPGAVSTSSEVCTPEMRERMRAAWGVEPHEIYGATDGLWGFTCERHAGIHFAEDETIVEVEDERLLITNLFMRTQPIIRYEITDLVRARRRAVRLRPAVTAGRGDRGPQRRHPAPARRGRRCTRSTCARRWRAWRACASTRSSTAPTACTCASSRAAGDVREAVHEAMTAR